MTLKRPFILMILVLIALPTSIYIFFDEVVLVEVYEDDIKEVSHAKPTFITIMKDNTHIRNGPSTEDDIILFAEQGSVFPIVSELSDWYEVDLNGETGFIWKHFFAVSQDLNAINILKNKLIILDAGHGGHDVGAIGAHGTFEKDLSYKTTEILKETLETLNAEVKLTRKDDQYIRLGSRTSFANMSNPDAFLSIHYNSYPQQEDIAGIGTYYYNIQSQYLARHVQNAIVSESNAVNRGTEFGNFQVLRESVNPSILLELGFISNGEQEKKLLTNEYQEVLVRGIIKGLTDYFHEQEKLKKNG